MMPGLKVAGIRYFVYYCYAILKMYLFWKLKLALIFGCESPAVGLNIRFSLVNNNRWRCKNDQ